MSENRGERVFYQMEDGKLPVVVGQLQPTPRHLGAGLAVIRRRDADITVPIDALKYADTGLPVPAVQASSPEVEAFLRATYQTNALGGIWKLPDIQLDDNGFTTGAWADV